MKHRTKTTALFFLALLLAGIAPLAAHGEESNSEYITFTPRTGWYDFQGNQNLEDKPFLGMSIGYSFDKIWELDAVLDYIDTQIKERASDDINAYLYHLDVFYNLLPEMPLIPYLMAGFGGIEFDPYHRELDSDESAFLVTYGLGLKYPINKILALETDARQVICFGDKQHNYMYTLGLSYTVGIEKEKIVTVEPKVRLDSDGDGVYDDTDKCPNTPKGVEVDSMGCPKDSDGDGVPDYMDECPNTPPNVPVDEKGCPKDSDEDGVLDNIDKCCNTPKGARVDKRGCWVIKAVLFDYDKWDIKPGAYPALDEAISVINQNPSLKIRVDGHTDNIGSDTYNKVLSEKRANSVMQYLLEKGIAQERLSAKGFSFSKPATSNNTEENRAQNRRVELTPLD
ncbi:MAG: OmpA family protein [Pseudomonadota bacterium]